MQGPFPLGSLSVMRDPQLFEASGIVRGGRYRVIKPFGDADGDFHPPGEEWRYIGPRFDRESDTFMLCVQMDDRHDWKIELLAHRFDPAQSDVITNFFDYAAPVGDDGIARPVPRDQRVMHVQVFKMTPAAAERARELCAQAGTRYLRAWGGHVGPELRCSIRPEGRFDIQKDIVQGFDGFWVLLDVPSMAGLRGATIEWEPGRAGGSFVVKPPVREATGPDRQT
jgi:Fe-S cluster assembly iron-binding protein IscA